MATLDNLLLNLAAAVIGFLTGTAWEFARQTIKYRRARKLWRPFVKGQLYVVVSRFFRDVTFEPSGYMGVGDTNALNELRSYLDRIGIQDFRIEYADAFHGANLKSNMILLGGPDGNQVTELVLSRTPITLSFQNYREHEVTVLDSTTGQHYAPQILDRGETHSYIRGTSPQELAGIELIRDYGIIVGSRNPFSSEHRVLIIAGSFGYGTWAGVRFTVSPAFSKHPLATSNTSFEALVEADIAKGEPQDIALVTMRALK